MVSVNQDQVNQIHRMVEEDLDEKIKRLQSLETQREKLVSLTMLILAALTDSGHGNLAKYIEGELKKAKSDV